MWVLHVCQRPRRPSQLGTRGQARSSSMQSVALKPRAGSSAACVPTCGKRGIPGAGWSHPAAAQPSPASLIKMIITGIYCYLFRADSVAGTRQDVRKTESHPSGLTVKPDKQLWLQMSLTETEVQSTRERHGVLPTDSTRAGRGTRPLPLAWAQQSSLHLVPSLASQTPSPLSSPSRGLPSNPEQS